MNALQKVWQWVNSEEVAAFLRGMADAYCANALASMPVEEAIRRVQRETVSLNASEFSLYLQTFIENSKHVSDPEGRARVFQIYEVLCAIERQRFH
jgi:hypothetical protein